MSAIAEAKKSAAVPDDVMLPKQDRHTLADGTEVQIKSLKLGGTLKLLAAFKQVELKTLPPVITAVDFLSDDQRAELRAISDHTERVLRLSALISELGAAEKLVLKQAARERLNGMLDWACQCEPLIPILIETLTDLEADHVADLEAFDALEILGKAIDLQNWDMLFEAGYGFFDRITGLAKAAGRRSAPVKAAPEVAPT
jgi:hypothetical protein